MNIAHKKATKEGEFESGNQEESLDQTLPP
jgi:hypothetical protein